MKKDKDELHFYHFLLVIFFSLAVVKDKCEKWFFERRSRYSDKERSCLRSSDRILLKLMTLQLPSTDPRFSGDLQVSLRTEENTFSWSRPPPLRPAPVPSSILPLGCGFFLSWEVSPLSLSNDAVISVSLHLSMSNESWSATELCWWWVGVKNKRRGDGGTWTGRGNAHQIRGGDSLKPFFLKLFQQWNESLCVWQVCLLIIRWNSGFIVC